MFTSKFQQSFSTPLPPTVNLQTAVSILHDFPVVIQLSPDCRGCKPIDLPQAKQARKQQGKTNGDASNDASTPQTPRGNTSYVPDAQSKVQHFEVEDDLPFIPKRLWNGGVKYIADFLPTSDGCDITVHAPGGFTSTNHWRIVREVVQEDQGQSAARPGLERAGSKDLLHADITGGGWYVQIISDAQCNLTFAGFVKGFLKNSLQQLQIAFIERLQTTPVQQRSRRPTVGRRRSSVF